MEKLRLKVQLLSAVLFNFGVWQFHSICFPVFNCHSCPISVFACPIGVMGQSFGVGIIPLTAIGGIALGGLLAGRLLCGWACPFGFLQELLYKIPFVKFSVPTWTRFIKYGVFLGLVVAVPIWLTTEFPLYVCRVCPVGTIESAIPWALMNGSANLGGLAIRLSVLFGIVLLVIGHRRFFCKALCPLGACLSVFNRFALLFPERKDDCIGCGTCNTVCAMETQPRSGQFGVYDDRPEECISCLECRKKCPTSAVNIWGG